MLGCTSDLLGNRLGSHRSALRSHFKVYAIATRSHMGGSTQIHDGNLPVPVGTVQWVGWSIYHTSWFSPLARLVYISYQLVHSTGQ